MAKEWDPDTILDILSDDVATDILVSASREPTSGRELVEFCEASSSTVYRRITVLEKHDFLVSHAQLAPDGEEYTVYQTALDGIEITVHNGNFTIDITIEKDFPD